MPASVPLWATWAVYIGGLAIGCTILAWALHRL